VVKIVGQPRPLKNSPAPRNSRFGPERGGKELHRGRKVGLKSEQGTEPGERKGKGEKDPGQVTTFAAT